MGPGNRKGAKGRTGPSKLLGPVRAATVLPGVGHLPVYLHAGLGARSPRFRPRFCFPHPPNHHCGLGGLHVPLRASISSSVKWGHQSSDLKRRALCLNGHTVLLPRPRPPSHARSTGPLSVYGFGARDPLSSPCGPLAHLVPLQVLLSPFHRRRDGGIRRESHLLKVTESNSNFRTPRCPGEQQSSRASSFRRVTGILSGQLFAIQM